MDAVTAHGPSAFDERLGDGVLEDFGGAAGDLVGLGVAEVAAVGGGFLGAVGAADLHGHAGDLGGEARAE